ncbi:MAG: MBL fold metallo-hydrolase [Ruminococcaceae bacterium]|nr:MBL fold metallo-hydrolase [Oscillospiraceae bacterium]
MTAYTLYSGSSGNCIYVKTADAEILFDAGVSARAVEKGLNAIGSSLSRIHAIFVTHEHSDHIKGLEVISKKYHIPTHMVGASARACIRTPNASLLNDLYLHPTVFSIKIGKTTIKSFPTPHDSAASVGYTVEYEQDGKVQKLGLATDIGHITEEITQALIDADSVIIEANHDVNMLLSGPYPYHLKLRILSDCGHLSNETCAEFSKFLATHGTKNFILAHLSKENNFAPIAETTVRNALSDFENINLAVALPDTPVLVGCNQTSEMHYVTDQYTLCRKYQG